MPEISELRLAAPQTATPDFSQGSIFFVGTATVILRYAGFTILTDPNFLHAGDHVHLGYGLTSKRLTNPAIDIEDLPPLDFCILSHMHEDHFDRVAEARLDKSLPIITTQHAAASLKQKGFQNPHGLKTWEAFTVVKGGARARVTAMPGTHAPGPLSMVLPPVMGSMLTFETEVDRPVIQIYISGDTLIFDKLKEIPQHYSEIDLMLLHLGGTRVLGLLVTMDDKQGVEAIRIIRPKKVIPIHYNDYTVFKSPLEDFKRTVAEAGLADKVVYLSHGETYNFEVALSQIE
jgi:L-ascorbate metabolism protein UlaG (beta-lactamase superfamily)